MDNNCQLTARLLETYKDLSSDQANMPSWAVHKRNYPDELVTPTIPFVHCGPLNDGGLLVAIMYLAYKLRNGKVEEPYSFYEAIAFGNYGKFSIETEFQKAVRNNPQMSMNEKNTLRKTLEKRNEDYAGAHKYISDKRTSDK